MNEMFIRGADIATRDQRDAVVKDLVAFVHRVALDKNATPAEIAALPEIAKVLCAVMPELV
ncbi:hypothetical protein [uncultured Oscillibacter sp.]|uniref:hypothetical protein n=1 Tax=uncultured Oscillibacter sp. TaxID=876091 RepID=UPI002616B210|nr:hypothetical protein [uncultured Oscillibacter sp.]